jgi:hypothetical protein
MNKELSWSDVHLPVLRALLHRVRPNWRKVAAEGHANIIEVRFCLDGPVEELDHKLILEVVEDIQQELGSDYTVKKEIVRVDYPNPDYDAKSWVYARSEEPIGPTIPLRCNIPLIPSDEETSE